MAQNANYSSKRRPPVVLFDAMAYVEEQTPPNSLTKNQRNDFIATINFLKCYTGSQGTFNAYRRETERLLQWTWLIEDKTLTQIKREDIEAFIKFCQKPPKAWIGLKKAPRFIDREGLRIPNAEWRPFVVTISKSAHRKGERPTKEAYEPSQNTIKEILAILSSYFNYLLQEEYLPVNPVALIRQKSKFVQKRQSQKIRRLSELQWQTVINTAERMAEENPQSHERTLFILSALYSMYLRISELVASDRWTPTMNDFHKDHNGLWWFTTVGKGNKERQIAVSDAMLKALKRWRKYLGLSQLPTPADQSPLIPKLKGKGAITNTTHIRSIVQVCFDRAIIQLSADGQKAESEALIDATVHWLRHTGISDDVKIRPREHVRDDAGHSSSAITDKYIDVELVERHRSAKRKLISG